MDKSELQACQEALEDIISVCESYKGLAEAYKDKPEEGEKPVAAEVVIEEGEPPHSAAEEAHEPAAEESKEPEPMSIVARPGAKYLDSLSQPVKRGRGRPRKGSY